MILSLWRKNPLTEAAEALFDAALAQARQPFFYARLGVADTLEGRFELLSLFTFLLLHRLKAEREAAGEMPAKLVAVFTARLDDALRESGVGDLVMGRKMRTLAEGFYGRAAAYEQALSAPHNDAIAAALARNVYGAERADGAAVLAAHVREVERRLAAHPLSRLLSGVVAFPAAPSSSEDLAP